MGRTAEQLVLLLQVLHCLFGFQPQRFRVMLRQLAQGDLSQTQRIQRLFPFFIQPTQLQAGGLLLLDAFVEAGQIVLFRSTWERASRVPASSPSRER